MRVVVKTPPAAYPVTLAQAKVQCRAVEFDDDDGLLTGLIATATSWLDGPRGWLGRCLLSQQLEARLHGFPPYFDELQHVVMRPYEACRVRLPYGPLISVDQILYIDPTGVQQTLDPSVYQVLDIGADDGAVQPAYDLYWPFTRWQPESVLIHYTAGFGVYQPVNGNVAALNPVPAAIQQAILLLVSHWYNHPDAVVGVDNRDSSVEMPLGVSALLSPYRTWA